MKSSDHKRRFPPPWRVEQAGADCYETVRHKEAVRVDRRQPEPRRKIGDQFVMN